MTPSRPHLPNVLGWVAENPGKLGVCVGGALVAGAIIVAAPVAAPIVGAGAAAGLLIGMSDDGAQVQ